jgi:hypothetical protein
MNYSALKKRGCWGLDETVDRARFASWYLAVDDGRESLASAFRKPRRHCPSLDCCACYCRFQRFAFLAWRWHSIAFGPDPVTRTWLLDKWHLGPLRLINFFVAASVISGLLKYLNHWGSTLRPLLLIGRHMLPVFCSQICVSVLLIGRTEAGLTSEPVTSALVLCQLMMAPLFAWLLEWRSAAKDLALPTAPMAALSTSRNS